MTWCVIRPLGLTPVVRLVLSLATIFAAGSQRVDTLRRMR